MKRKRLTIKDIAKKAGVSVSTVSQVLNNKGRISSKTKKRVLEVIEEVNFYPSRAGRALVQRKSGNIGVFVSHEHFTIKEPFYNHIYFGSEVVAQESDYYLILNILKSQNNSFYIPRCVADHSIDGAIILGEVSDSLIDLLASENLPMVFVDYLPKRRDIKFSAVLIDNVNGAKMAVNHLINLGYKRIGFIGKDFEHPSIKDRYKGYRIALKESQLPLLEEFVFTDKKKDDVFGYKVAQHIAKSGDLPDAVFCANDSVAVYFIKGFFENNIRVPNDIAVVGFDNIEIASHIYPPLTTVHVFREEIGQIAMKQALSMLENKSFSGLTTYVNTKLVIRKSCGSKESYSDEELYL